MKKIKFIFITVVAVTMAACSSDADYEGLNKDPNNPVEASAESLFSAAQKTLVDEVNDIDYRDAPFTLYAQYAQQTTYTDESQYDMKNRGIPGEVFSEVYQNILFDLKDAASLVTDDDFKSAQIELLAVYAWQYLVDNFGDIPYTEALKVVGADQVLAPKYDDDATIYVDLMSRAVAAKTLLAGSGKGFSSADFVLAGDKDAWVKFANSLIVKIGVRATGNTFKSEVEAAASGAVASNADNVTMDYEGSTPNTNPSWLELVQSGRNDYVLGKPIVDALTSTDLEDPRQDVFFDPTSKIDGAYKGGVIGQKSAWSAHSKLGTKLFDPTFRGVLFDFAEISFYLADAAARGWSVGGDAATHYANGIKASFTDWGLTEAAADAYLLKPKVAYATADGTSDEKIGKQLWIAMFNRGFEGWTAYRRYGGAPLTQSELGAGDFKEVPRRLTYPVVEQTRNPSNYTAASTAIGGDEQSTKIFWDN